MPEFHTKEGWLTRWALQCGYQECHNYGGIYTRMYMEHGVIHVRQYDHNVGRKLAWEVFTEMSPARKRYKELCRRGPV